MIPLSVTLTDDGRALCCDIEAVGANRIQDLCRQLVARGERDVSLRLRWPNGRPCAFVSSIYDCAAAT